MLQNVTESRCLIQEMLQNTEAETTECYEMIYKMIWAPTFHNIWLHSGIFPFSHNVFKNFLSLGWQRV